MAAITWFNSKSDVVSAFVDDVTHELLAHEQCLGFYYNEKKGHGRIGYSDWVIKESTGSFSQTRQAIIELLTIIKGVINNF